MQGFISKLVQFLILIIIVSALYFLNTLPFYKSKTHLNSQQLTSLLSCCRLTFILVVKFKPNREKKQTKKTKNKPAASGLILIIN